VPRRICRTICGRGHRNENGNLYGGLALAGVFLGEEPVADNVEISKRFMLLECVVRQALTGAVPGRAGETHIDSTFDENPPEL
jgi:hypothetical protein